MSPDFKPSFDPEGSGIDSIYHFTGKGLGELRLWLEQEGLDIKFRNISDIDLMRARVSVTNSGTTSIPDAIWTTVNMDTTNFDYGGDSHSDTVNNSRITCRAYGQWVPFCNVAWGASAAGNRQVRVLKNGLNVLCISNGPPTPESFAVTFPPYTLEVGDYLQFQVALNSGGALDLYGGTNLSFGMYRIG